MASDFAARFAAGPKAPLGLQLLFATLPDWDEAGLQELVREYHDELSETRVELVPANSELEKFVSTGGPPLHTAGLIEWGQHRIRLAAFAGPMPYGPLETCVGPALMDPALKEEAKTHGGHVLLAHTGTHSDPFEQFVALAAVAGSLALLGASVILNEEARSAVPAFDLVPDPEEDALATIRGLPVPYLFGGFLRMDTGDPNRPWVRTFANHRLNLPNLAWQLPGIGETARAFELFAGLLGYLRATGIAFQPGDRIDLGEKLAVSLRSPAPAEWFLDSEGFMLVLEMTAA